MAAWV